MKKIILLVEDDIDDASIFCEALLLIDPEIACYCAIDGIEAPEILQKDEHPNIIFLDINMPRMNGWEFLRKMKCIDRGPKKYSRSGNE